jgi:hypothetical protein
MIIRSQAVVNQALDRANGAGAADAANRANNAGSPRGRSARGSWHHLAWLAAALLVGCVRVQPATDPGFVATENNDEPVDAGRDGGSGHADGKPPKIDATVGDATRTDAAGGTPDGGGPSDPDAGAPADADAIPADTGAADLAGRDVAGVDAGAAGDPVPGGLVAAWAFDEGAGTTAGDRAGQGNQASLHNGVAWKPSGVPGAARPSNFAVELDGSDDYLDVPAPKLPALDAAKSIAFWFSARADAPPVVGSTQRTCLALLAADGAAGLQIGLDRDRPAAWNVGQNQGFVTAPAVPAPGFHHWAYTFDGTAHRLFLDGRSVATRNLPQARGSIASFLIGTYAVPNEMCAGQLDDLRIYDRALTNVEIATLAARP